MDHIFIGFLLIFLDFNINLGNSTVGLIPDFIGYIFLVRGLNSLHGESPLFAKAHPAAVGMGIYSALLYAGDLLGITAALGWLGIGLGLISTIISLYISYLIVMGIREMENNHSAKLNGENLQFTWKIMAIVQIATYITLLVPLLSLVFILASFILGIVFLVSVNTSKNLYRNLPG